MCVFLFFGMVGDGAGGFGAGGGGGSKSACCVCVSKLMFGGHGS